MVAIAESTPGPIAINAATYIGYRVLRFRGSLIATVGVCIPSFAIIYVISLFFDKFLSLTLVANAFKGIQICVIYLIFSAGVKMLKGISKTPFNVITIIAVMSAMIITSILPVWAWYYILYSARGYHKDRFLYDILCKIQIFLTVRHIEIWRSNTIGSKRCASKNQLLCK